MTPSADLDTTGDGKQPNCTEWCSARHAADPACWGADEHKVLLSVEKSYPDAEVGAYAYRQTPAHREVVYLHVYRPDDNDFRDLDASVHLTADEARGLAEHLIAVVDEIGGKQ
ncbi:hypothetical protein MI149_00070 [Mycolicibacterium crocinum]|uniref:Lipoprotein n=1 Tax=Mycolicibacterium crocinum TaxID=388459 RepID=A0ABY3TPE8_9MYCO|nr:hypothetical protein MI149_00070 [Mycolicibacterium crocinum]